MVIEFSLQRCVRLALVGLALFLTQCAEFQGVFQTASNTTRYSTQSAPVARANAKGRPLSLEKVAKPGTVLEGELRQPIVTKQGTYYFVRSGDTLGSISDRFKMDWEHVAQINGLYDSDLVVGRRLFIPNKKTLEQYVVVSKVINQDRSTVKRSRKLEFAWPIEQPRINSVFGHRRGRPHDGLDIGAQVGTPVLAAEEGRVIFSERFTSYGNLIVIKHPDDYFTAYAHNSAVYVKKGQRVKKGQKISLVGMTGRTTGPHLHFEMRLKTQAIDPLSMLPKTTPPKL